VALSVIGVDAMGCMWTGGESGGSMVGVGEEDDGRERAECACGAGKGSPI
jgi:hypothetical protein